jgi:hypothetical protein
MMRIETGRQARGYGWLGALLLAGTFITLAVAVDPGFILGGFLVIGWLMYCYAWSTNLPDTVAEAVQKQRLQAEQDALGRIAPGGRPGTYRWSDDVEQDSEWLRQQFALADELTNDDHQRIMEEL